ncbi:MAG: GAF domain-containing protein [Anaerolineae bacterium]|nr:GAF domain-containing protein [Anaerolineae bacterium]
MDEKRTQEHLHDADRVLNDIREHLEFNQEMGDVYELKALQLLLEVTKSMHVQRDIRALMTLVLDSALSFAEADRAFLLMTQPDGSLRFKMGRTYDGHYLTEENCVISTSVTDAALEAREPIILADAQHDNKFSARQSIIDLNLRTIMTAPLRCDENVLGLIYVDSKRPMARYSKHHLNVLSSLADQSAVALHNARKFETHTG